MKTRYAMVILTMGMSVAAMAQENDDMYFNSKDRVVVAKANAQVLAKRYQEADRNAVITNPVNPSDSYSGRGVNPEYSAQGKNGTSMIQNNPDYFLSSYQPKNVNSSLSSGNNTYYSGYNNGMYNNGMSSPYGYGSSMMGYGGMGYGMNSMMGYGMGYGMNSMMGYGMGMGGYPYSMFSMGYGMGGYGSGFYGSYGMGYGMGSMYGMGMGMGMGMGSMYNPYGYGYGGYNSAVINETRTTSYGRHSVRSSGLNNYVDNSRGTSSVTNSTGVGRTSQSGRTGGSQQDYYDRGWRSNSNNFPTRSGYDNSSYGNTRGGNSSWGNSGTRSSFDSFGGGSRSSFGGGGGGGFSGGGGGHSRGRN